MKIQQQELYNNLLTYVENNHDNQLLLEKIIKFISISTII